MNSSCDISNCCRDPQVIVANLTKHQSSYDLVQYSASRLKMFHSRYFQAFFLLFLIRYKVWCCDDVTKDSLLCRGTVSNYLFGIHVFTLTNSNLTDLPPAELKALTNISKINFSKNNISHIKTGVFTGLNIISLDLSYNEIFTIDSGAFDNMSNFRYLKLDHNKINQWDPKWFKNTPNIHEISVAHNYISELPSNAFDNIKWFHNYDVFVIVATGINIEHNKIAKIHPKVFGNATEIGAIILSNNDIEDISPEVFSDVVSVDNLNLSHNYLSCDTLRMLLNLGSVNNINLKYQRINGTASELQRK